MKKNNSEYPTDASKLVDKVLTQDEKSVDFIHKQTMKPFEDDSIFVNKQEMNIPKILYEQYKHLKFKSFMGVFGEVNRAWVTIDNKFYIWNFLDGSDFNEFDEMDQVIVSCALVVPKVEVFKSYVKYVLVIASTIRIILVAVTYDENELNLLPTTYSVTTDTNMLKIRGNKDGRIFCCGQNGTLHELNYSLDDGWIYRKCYLSDVTSSFIYNLYSPRMFFTPTSSIIDIAVDNMNNVLYTLTINAVIFVYDLGEFGSKVNRVGFIDVLKAINKKRGNTFWDGGKIISIFAIENSSNANLVAISSKGVRFYFNVSENLKFYRPKFIKLMDDVLPKRHLNVHESFYSNGIFIFASSADYGDLLRCIVCETKKDKTHIAIKSGNLIETISKVKIKGRPVVISEIFSPIAKSVIRGKEDSKRDSKSQGIRRSELQCQHSVPPREFVCLTNRKIILIVKKRPVDQLQELLSRGDQIDYKRISGFYQKYGSDEASQMCLILICQGTYSATDQLPFSGKKKLQTIPNAGISKNAENVFFRFGGIPSFRKTMARAAINLEFRNRQRSNFVIFSASHNGLCLYVSRILLPVWNFEILNFSTDTENSKKPKITGIRMASYEISEMIELLFGVRMFMERYPHIFQLQQTTVVKKGIEDALRLEKQSLFKMYKLLVRSIECLSFMSLLTKMEIGEILNNENENIAKVQEVKANIMKMKFKDFVTTKKGIMTMKNVINLTTKARNVNVDELFKIVEKNCPNLFNPGDISGFRAFDLIQKAKQYENPHQQKEIIEKALNSYLNIAGNIQNITAVCNDFLRLKFYVGAVKLALRAAEKIDPTSIAEDWIFKDGRKFGDTIAKEKFEKRENCYKSAINVLEKIINPDSIDPKINYQYEKNRVLFFMLNSNDKLFHFSLYNWFLKGTGEKKRDELLNFKTPYLEEFLLKHERFELLAKYYRKNEKYIDASDIMDKLSQHPSEKINLDKRIQYLTNALMNAKSASLYYYKVPKVRDVGEIIKTVENKLLVANLQKSILGDLRRLYEKEKLPEVRKLMRHLNSRLERVSFLYNECAVKYDLYICCLEILNVSKYNDKILIRNYWSRLLVNKSRNEMHRIMRTVISRLGIKSIVFPIDYVVYLLEQITYPSIKTLEDELFVKSLLLNLSVDCIDVYLGYRKIFEYLFEKKYSDPLMTEDNFLIGIFRNDKENAKLHILFVISHLVADIFTRVDSTETDFPKYVLIKNVDQYNQILNGYKTENFTNQKLVVIKNKLLSIKEIIGI